MEPFLKEFPFPDFFGDHMFKDFRGHPHHRGGESVVGIGSGVIVSPDGYILTNAHVVKGMDKISVSLTDKRGFKAKLVGADPESDLAVIKIDANNLPVATLGDSDRIRVGDIVEAIGNPFGLNGTVTSGIVSAKGRTNVGIVGYKDFIQTDAAINPGNSGGPLVDMQGEVVGINTAIVSNSGGYQGVGFAIPSNSAKLVMDQLIHGDKVDRGFLGINIQDVTEALAKSFGRNDTNGALISKVVPGGPADKAGLKSGDIVLSFNGQPVSDAAQLKVHVGEIRPNTTVTLSVRRDKKTRDVAVTVGELTEKMMASGPSQTGSSGEMGLELEKVPAGEAKHMGLKAGVGLVVKDVASGGFGSKIGLQKGDVILEIDGKSVTDVPVFNKEVDVAKKDHVVRLMVQRGSETIYLAETIG